LSTVSTLTTHLVLRSTANAIAEALKGKDAYASNIKVNGDGIELKADDILPSNNTTMKVAHGGLSVKSTTLGSATFDMKPGSVSLVSNDTYQTAKMVLEDAGATLQTKFGEVNIGRDKGASMNMALSGITMKSSPNLGSVLALTSDAASMLYNKKSGFSAKTLSVQALSAKLSAGGTTLSVSGSGATVNGAMIRLG